MTSVVLMPRNKKAGQTPGEEKNDPPQLETSKKKKVPNVKLTPILHYRLSLIATWKHTNLKALVNAQLEQFVKSEWEAFQLSVKNEE